MTPTESIEFSLIRVMVLAESKSAENARIAAESRIFGLAAMSDISATVPVLSGKVIMLSLVGSTARKNVSLVSLGVELALSAPINTTLLWSKEIPSRFNPPTESLTNKPIEARSEYTSAKFWFILIAPERRVSPVPSFPALPTAIICLAISKFLI